MRLLDDGVPGFLEALEVRVPVPGAPNDDDDDTTGDLGDCDFFTETGSGTGCFPATTTIVIANIRVNAAALAPFTPITATVTMTGPDTVSIFPETVTIALPRLGLTVEVDGDPDNGLEPKAGLLCETSSRHPTIKLSEGFATSFKTIGVPSFAVGNTQVESGYFSPGSGVTGGGATQGTRFKIWFLNVPDGVTVEVPTGMNNACSLADDPDTEALECGAGDASHDCSDFANWDGDALCLGLISFVDEWGAKGSPATYGDGMTSVDIDDGMGMVVYEVFDGNPLVTESCTLDAWFSWDAGAADPGTAQIAVSFAPIATGLEDEYSFVADAVSPRLRFIDTSSPADGFALRKCSTTLLFPWVTNQSRFDTGFAISNTSKDWLDTPHQSGVCRVHWHGADANGPTDAGDDTESGIIEAGEQFVFVASTALPGFQGYVIVLCDFQFAHGFAFLTDGFGGTPTLAQGYLALVLEEYDSGGARVGPEASDQ